MPEIKLWVLYMVRTREGSLYTGITTDVQRRFREHDGSFANGSKGAKALRGKGPLTLVYQDEIGTRSEAQQAEYKVKQLSKMDKELIVKRQRPLKLFL
jgi:putative endonuclease